MFVPPKDTIELLKMHPTYFGSSSCSNGCAAHRWKMDARPKKITFVLSQPRCGSTLLMRLMNLSCMSHMTGDRPQKHYRAIIDLYQSVNDGGGQFGHPVVMEDNFCDEYRGTSLDRDRHSLQFMVQMMLFQGIGAGYAKSATIGFGNQDVLPFVEMLRDTLGNDPSIDLTIVYLTRDHDEIIKSVKRKIQEKGLTYDESRWRSLLQEQYEQFKEARELGEPLIRYENIVNEHYKTIMKCNPLYEPNLRAAQKILANKIR